jgi:hypothetical protein
MAASDGLSWAPLPPEPWLQPPKWLFSHLVYGLVGVPVALFIGWSFWLSPALGLTPGSVLETGLSVALAVALPIALGLWSRVLMADLNHRWDTFTARQGDGNIAGSLDALERCCRHNRVPKSHARSLYALALLSLRLGDLARARALAASLEQHPGRNATTLALSTPGLMALLEAVEGHAEKSRAFASEARRRRVVASNSLYGLELLAEVLLLARADRWADAEAMMQRVLNEACDPEAWDDPLGRSVIVLDAFVNERASNDAEEVQAILEHAQPHAPRDFDWLGTGWPEMAAFVAKVPVGGTPPADS